MWGTSRTTAVTSRLSYIYHFHSRRSLALPFALITRASGRFRDRGNILKFLPITCSWPTRSNRIRTGALGDILYSAWFTFTNQYALIDCETIATGHHFCANKVKKNLLLCQQVITPWGRESDTLGIMLNSFRSTPSSRIMLPVPRFRNMTPANTYEWCREKLRILAFVRLSQFWQVGCLSNNTQSTVVSTSRATLGFVQQSKRRKPEE